MALHIKVNEKNVNEGIDIDYINHVVMYNPGHQNNVDTSIENNPTVDEKTIPGVEVWSIFTRNRVDTRDGNPLVYAMKGEKNWKFRSEADRKAIDRQFKAIADKFLESRKYDVTIIAPTSNDLNNYIVSVITQKKPDIEYIPDALIKLSTGDIAAMVDDMESTFFKVYRRNMKNALKKLFTYLDRMDELKNGVFTRHFIEDSEMRDVLDKTLKCNPDKIAQDAVKINDHDVLIVDDTISRGQTIKEIVDTIKACYNPKSITVLTLFSRLQ